MDSFLQQKAKIYLPRYFNCLNSWVIEKSNKLHAIKLNSSYRMFWLASMTLFCSWNIEWFYVNQMLSKFSSFYYSYHLEPILVPINQVIKWISLVLKLLEVHWEGLCLLFEIGLVFFLGLVAFVEAFLIGQQVQVGQQHLRISLQRRIRFQEWLCNYNEKNLD